VVRQCAPAVNNRDPERRKRVCDIVRPIMKVRWPKNQWIQVSHSVPAAFRLESLVLTTHTPAGLLHCSVCVVSPTWRSFRCLHRASSCLPARSWPPSPFPKSLTTCSVVIAQEAGTRILKALEVIMQVYKPVEVKTVNVEASS
jgi:hypothetical protein